MADDEQYNIDDVQVTGPEWKIPEVPKKHAGGRPRKVTDIDELYYRQTLANIEFAGELLAFAKEQLQLLKEEVKQVAGIKQRLEVMKAVNSVAADFVKIVRTSMADGPKKPGDASGEKEFSLEAFLAEQQH